MVGSMQAASLSPETFVDGGLFEGNDVLREPRFVRWDYGGRTNPQGQAIMTLAVRGVLVDDEGTGHEQFWSSGSMQDFVPSPDGKMAIPQSGKQGLNRNTNAATMLSELVNAGFPANRLGSDLSSLDGLYATWNRRPAPERPGLSQPASTGGRAPQILVTTRIINMPWEPSKHPNGGQIVKLVTASQGASTTTQAQANQIPGMSGGAPMPQGQAIATSPIAMTPPITPVAVDAATGDKAQAYILKFVEQGPRTRQDLAAGVFNPASGLNNDPARNQLSALVYDEAFLQSLAARGVIKYDGQTVSR